MARVFPFLRTQRLTLRPPKTTDAAVIAREIGNYDVARWLVSVPYPYHERDARSFIAECEPGRIWVIEDDAGLCGAIDTRGELGYWLARRAWGKGYLTEAGDTVLDAYFEDRRHKSIVSGYMTENARSASVLSKLGFERVGTSLIGSVSLGQDVASEAVRLSRSRWRERRRYRLATKRLRLRELHDSDRNSINRLLTKTNFVSAIPNAFQILTGQAGRTWLDPVRYRGRPGFGTAITTRTGRLVGVMVLGRESDNSATDFSIFIDEAYRGQGLMREAAAAFLADVTERFDLEKVLSEYPVDASAGRDLLQDLGFVPTRCNSTETTERLEPGARVIYRLERSNLRADP
ncbi:GNAT family N-acetyltransferase [Palleronia sp. LCG004]|uniref:GNAT family N-acetyltransferase n=1 Tax=Palleronia sp. LCG004 TaxID=3079304 RepID=UPI0029423C7F|nr:GNAT family N-acetyltransferase [Palleronia sp. LCG004]WOI56987.1 GNAT family N-acetyltransferase [Palleronia sp. LCG004]